MKATHVDVVPKASPNADSKRIQLDKPIEIDGTLASWSIIRDTLQDDVFIVRVHYESEVK